MNNFAECLARHECQLDGALRVNLRVLPIIARINRACLTFDRDAARTQHLTKERRSPERGLMNGEPRIDAAAA